jgi:hypothetical protein
MASRRRLQRIPPAISCDLAEARVLAKGGRVFPIKQYDLELRTAGFRRHPQTKAVLPRYTGAVIDDDDSSVTSFRSRICSHQPYKRGVIAKREPNCTVTRQLPCECAIYSVKGSNHYETYAGCCANVTEIAPRLSYILLTLTGRGT